MPILTPDTSEMEDFRPSVPGTYRARITKCGSQATKAKGDKPGGKPMAVPTFQFEAPALEDQGSGPRKVNRQSFLMISGGGSFGFDQLLRAIGEGSLADQVKANPGRVPVDTAIFENKEVQVVIANSLYEGKLQDSISSFLPV